MALINCSECDKQVSDKAASCPNCGNPIASVQVKEVKRYDTSNDFRPVEEEKFRCPKCKSERIEVNKKGFGVGKALVGGILTGGVGLAAGFIGSNKVKATCLKCNHKFDTKDGFEY